MGKKHKSLQNNSTELERKVMTVAASFSGPLPPPHILEGYEKIQSGAADRIIKMAEQQASHRQELEKSVIKSNIKNEHIGMWLAFTLTAGLMIFGGYLIMNDKDTIGYFAIFGPVVFHAANYIYNKKREENSSEKEHK